MRGGGGGRVQAYGKLAIQIYLIGLDMNSAGDN